MSAPETRRGTDAARLERIAAEFVAAGTGQAGRKNRRQAADRFVGIFGGITAWNDAPAEVRMATPAWV